MKRRLTNVSPLKLGITLAVIYGMVSLVFLVPFFLVVSLIGAASARTGAQALPVFFTGVFVVFFADYLRRSRIYWRSDCRFRL